MTIVAAGFDDSTAAVGGALAARAPLAHVRDDRELEALLASRQVWEAVVLGPTLADPLATAKRLRARFPDTPIVVLAEPSSAARLQHALLLASVRGDPVRLVPLDASAPRAIEQHLRQAFLRRRHSAAIRSANQALAAPAATPVARLPPATEQLLEATPLPILVVEPSGRVMHRNRAARALQPARATTVEEALEGMEAPLRDLVAHPDRARPLRRVAWRGRAYDVLASPLTLPPSIEAAVILVDDVTDVVQAEEAARREAELHATMLAAQSDLGEGVLFVRGATIAFANDALAALVRRPVPELVGMSAYDLVAPEDRALVMDTHARRRRGERVPDSYETTFVAADGERIPVEVGARSLDGGGSTVVLVRDIRRRRAMQLEIERARAGLAQMDKLATVGSLVSGLAHEIRTPLAALMNEAHLISMQTERALKADDPRAHLASVGERVAAMDEAIDRIRRLMSDMRGFIRGDPPAKVDMAVDACIQDAVRFFASTQRGQVAVATRLAARGLVRGDPAQIQQIVINLLQNAADASPSGGEIAVETRDEEDDVVVSVVDRGSGIPPEIQARMFEAFVTTKPRGTGLGLTIVRRLAELHGARLVVDSVPGRGTRIDVRFPRAHPPDAPGP